MTWIRWDAKALASVEVIQLAARLRIRTAEAVGLVIGVCCGARIHRPTGIVGDLANGTLEMWAGWRGRKGRFAAVFRELFVTPHGRLRGWREIRYGPRRPPILPSLRRAVFQRDGYACIHCGSDANLQLDHIEPWCDGGPDEPANLQTLCGECNRKKGPRPWSRAGRSGGV